MYINIEPKRRINLTKSSLQSSVSPAWMCWQLAEWSEQPWKYDP